MAASFPLSALETALRKEVRAVARALKRKRLRLVLAESCTGGLLAAAFSEIPGISEVFCGSHVVYREDSKTRWLGVSPATLRKYTAVSAETAAAMARGALRKTPEARIAVSLTGYLGPGGSRVGTVYVAVLSRESRKIRVQEFSFLPTQNLRIAETPRKSKGLKDAQNPLSQRLRRRLLAAYAGAFLVHRLLDS